MARLLYRLGRWAAAHATRVVIAWVVLLLAGAGLMLGLGRNLSSTISLDGVPAQEVVDELKDTFPEAARGAGQVVFHTQDGSAFTDAQRTAISEALTSVATMPAVANVIDPFATQAQLDDAREKAANGAGEIAAGLAKLDEAQAKIDAGRAQLANGTAELNAAQAKIDAGRAKLAAKEPELVAGQAKIDAGRKQIAAAKAELTAGQQQIDQGTAQLKAAQADLDQKMAAVDAAIAQALAAGAPQSTIDELLANKAKLEAGQTQLDAKRAELQAGQAKLDAGRKELTAKEAELNAGQVELDAGKQQLASGKAELDAGQAKIDAGRATIASKLTELDAGQATIDDGRAKLEDGRSTLALGQRLTAASTAFNLVSDSGSVAIGTVQFEKPLIEIDPSVREAIVDALSQADIPGVDVEFSSAFSLNFESVIGASELLGLLVAAVVLFIMLRTLIGAGLPVLSALLGVGISTTLTMALSSQIEMANVTPVLGIMLGLAVGIDYSLFILNRHRRQLKAGVELHESIGFASGTSGSAVLFAGMTVMIALLALNLTGMTFLGLMGSVGAFAIVIAVLAALTFTPAMLRIVGMRILTRKERARLVETGNHTAEAEPRHASKPVMPNRHPWLSIVTASIIVILAAIPAAGMRLGLPDGSQEPPDSTQYRAFSITSEAFGAGSNGQIATVVRFPQAVSEDAERSTQADVADMLIALDNVSAVVPAAISPDRTKMLFEVIPTTSPSSVETEQLVHDIRDMNSKFESAFGATVGVTGLAAMNIDMSAKIAGAMPIYLTTVIVLSVLLLIVVFRSIWVPLLASAGFLATVMATFGAVVAVFQNGNLGFLFGVHEPGPVLSFLPIILIGVLFGLAMDYQLFVTSGIREAHIHGKSSNDAINYGLHLSRGVVAAAAIIMIFVFGAFTFSHLTMIRPVGFGLAIGVLIDAFIVRLVLIPSVMTILGERAWWLPKWLDKILPNLDVEGASLEREQLH